jgi:ABC-2 type transport system ATP-binding protein
MNAHVEIRGLSKTYGRTPAIDRVDLDVGTGVVGLLGPNGAGKTTLLRILATALAPTAGTVRILGHDPGQAAGRLAIRRTLGYVPQEVGLYETFTVFDFIDYIAILKEHVDRAARRAEVRRVIDAVDLGDVRSKRIHALSGGMRRRVALAQSLLGDPQLLVLDEPTVGLDPEQRLRFRQIVSQHVERRCVILSTHMTEDVEALCDRVIVMDRGQIAFDGTPASLAGIAAGHVWIADQPDPLAMVSWRTGEGRHRHVGDPPPGAELIAPTVQDGYLVLNGGVPDERAA